MERGSFRKASALLCCAAVVMFCGVSSVHASVQRLLLKHDSEEEDAVRKTFYHHNHLGSTAITTDEEGELLTRVHYYPYGTIRQTAAELPTYNFTGKERDTTTGLSYHSARYLSPTFANWTQPDPLFHTLSDKSIELPWQASNPYGYGLQNPIQYTDPSGTVIVTPESMKDKDLPFDPRPLTESISRLYEDNIRGHIEEGVPIKDNLGSNLLDVGLNAIGMNNFGPFAVVTGPIKSLVQKFTKKAAKPISKYSRKRIKKLIKKYSDNSRVDKGLSQEKTDRLRRVVEKAGGKLRNDSVSGVKGTSAGKPHMQTEGLGKSIDSRHICIEKGVK